MRCARAHLGGAAGRSIPPRMGAMLLSRRTTANAANGDQLPAPRYARGNATVYFGRAEDHYAEWPTPTCIIADGPYGVDGFPGDQPTPATLAEWYEPHVKT